MAHHQGAGHGHAHAQGNPNDPARVLPPIANLPQRNASEGAVQTKKEQLHGSNAGAGSGTFALYRRHRRTELSRIRDMDEAADVDARNAEFAKRLEENKAQDALRTEKNAARRKRRRKGKQESDDGTAAPASDHDDDGSQEDEAAQAELARQAEEMMAQVAKRQQQKQDVIEG